MKVHAHRNADLVIIDDLTPDSIIEVSDNAGKIIRRFHTVMPSCTIDVDTWAPGIYSFCARFLNQQEIIRVQLTHS